MGKTWQASLDNVRDICQYVMKNVLDFGLTLGDAQKLELAVEEVVVNIIKYSGVSNNTIKVVVAKGHEKILVKIADKGKPFNPLEYREPALNVSILDRPVGGLGIFLVRKMVDEIKYERVNNENVLTLAKFIKSI